MDVRPKRGAQLLQRRLVWQATAGGNLLQSRPQVPSVDAGQPNGQLVACQQGLAEAERAQREEVGTASIVVWV